MQLRRRSSEVTWEDSITWSCNSTEKNLTLTDEVGYSQPYAMWEWGWG